MRWKRQENIRQIANDSVLEERLLSWLLEDCQKERLDACQKGEATVEESYFACQELMKQMILEKEPDIKEDYMNYFIEKAYSQMGREIRKSYVC